MIGGILPQELRFAMLVVLCASGLSACSGVADLDLADPPELSPVGAGLFAQESAILKGGPMDNSEMVNAQMAAAEMAAGGPIDAEDGSPQDGQPMYPSAGPMPAATGSLWDDRGGDLFRNPRAGVMGDVLTVEIEIDDEADIDNKTDRFKDANANIDLGIIGDLASTVMSSPFSFDVNGQADAQSSSSTKGEGSITRSEKISLSVAAVVTSVLPNGFLHISGSQEIRVDQEVRVLTIAGIVRPNDISGDNTIPYDKIAEARISYGGRGRISEMQNPSWGQRLFDKTKPF